MKRRLIYMNKQVMEIMLKINQSASKKVKSF